MGVVGRDGVQLLRFGAGWTAGESGDLGGERVVEEGLEHVGALEKELEESMGVGIEETYHEAGAADDDC